MGKPRIITTEQYHHGYYTYHGDKKIRHTWPPGTKLSDNTWLVYDPEEEPIFTD